MTPYIRLPKAIFELFAAGESIAAISDEFDIDAEECELLLRLQCRVLSLPKSKAQFKRLLGRYISGNPVHMNYESLRFAAVYAHQHGYEIPEWVRLEWKQIAKKLVVASILANTPEPLEAPPHKL